MLRSCRHGFQALVSGSRSPRPSASASYHTIQAVPREWTGSRMAARERAQGRIPSVVFTQGEIQDITDGKRPISRKQLLTTDWKQINSILKTVQPSFFCSTTFNLQIRAGPSSSLLLDSGTVLPIKVHRNPESGQILNLVFVWADGVSEMSVDVPVVFKGEDLCPGLKKGGYLNMIRTSLKFLCPVEHIPQKIEVDLSNLDIGDKILMTDVAVHPSLKLMSKNENIPVCKISATRSEIKDSAETS